MRFRTNGERERERLNRNELTIHTSCTHQGYGKRSYPSVAAVPGGSTTLKFNNQGMHVYCRVHMRTFSESLACIMNVHVLSEKFSGRGHFPTAKTQCWSSLYNMIEAKESISAVVKGFQTDNQSPNEQSSGEEAAHCQHGVCFRRDRGKTP